MYCEKYNNGIKELLEAQYFIDIMGDIYILYIYIFF